VWEIFVFKNQKYFFTNYSKKGALESRAGKKTYEKPLFCLQTNKTIRICYLGDAGKDLGKSFSQSTQGEVLPASMWLDQPGIGDISWVP